MRTNWIGKSVVALSMAAACAVPACDSSKTEPVSQTTGAATTGLQPGDLAITCYNSVSNGGLLDFLQITPLRDIDNDSDIRLTDREATAAGDFDSDNEAINEAIPLRAADAGVAAILAGTPVFFNPVTGIGASEQVFIYQGTISAAVDAGTLTGNFLWGIQNSPGGGWAAVRGADVSERLTALAAGDNDTALNSTTGLTWFYDTAKGPSTGTKAVLRAAIHNPNNWTVATTAGSSVQCPTGLTVQADPTDAGDDAPVDSGAAGSGDAAPGTGGAAGSTDAGNNPGTGGAAGSADAGPGTGGVIGTGGAVDSGTDVTGTGGMGTGGSTDAGTDVTGTGGMGTGGSTDAGTDVTGTGGMGTGGSTDAGTDVTGTGGAAADASSDATGTGGRGTGGSTGGDAGTDVRADTGTATDVRADTGTATDAKADTGTASDAKADSKADVKTGGGGSSGCSCSTGGSTSDSLATSAWMLALGGIIFTARRRRRRQ